MCIRDSAIPFGNVAEGLRILAEQRGLDLGLGRDDLVQQLLVFGEFADEGEHEPGLAGTGGADGELSLIHI